MKIISVDTMRSLDRQTIELGTPGEVLMERAGIAAAGKLLAFAQEHLSPDHRRQFAVMAGRGNNGGDGYVVACFLSRQTQADVAVYSVCDPDDLTGAAAHHAGMLDKDIGVTVCNELPGEALTEGTVVVDALLGTGISGPLRPPYDRIISQINQSGLPVVALDVPSGLDADGGMAETEAVVADMTVTMAQPKRGLLTDDGMARSGIISCVDIGIPERLVEEAPGCGEACFASDVAGFLSRRPHASHKGTFGRVLVAGGSKLYRGAPFLAGAGALRGGAGLVTVAVPGDRVAANSSLDALIVRSVEDAGTGFLGDPSVGELKALLDQAGTVVFGPGIGRGQSTRSVLRAVLQSPLPVVVDADGLRSLAESPGLISRDALTVLTPHPGEMRGLLRGFGFENKCATLFPRAETAAKFAGETGAWVVLKGMGTVVAAPDGRWSINTSGTNALSTAGTGDVLAGLLGGLLAQGMAPWNALRTGTFLHGLAAELAPAGRSLVADDLPELIGRAFRKVTPFP